MKTADEFEDAYKLADELDAAGDREVSSGSATGAGSILTIENGLCCCAASAGELDAGGGEASFLDSARLLSLPEGP